MSISVSVKRRLTELKSRLAPNHFEVLTRLLCQLLGDSNRPIRVLDIGAGSAWYWRGGILGNLVSSGRVELSILEPANETKYSTSLVAKRIPGVAPESLVALDSGSFDVVMAFDVIEHLAKDQGYLLIYHMERLSAQAAIIFTPNGWVWQPPSSNNPFNAHVSGWKPNEFPRSLGWKVIGQHGPKWAFGPYGISKPFFARNIFGRTILESFSAITVLVPSTSYAFLGISFAKNRHSVQDQPDVVI